MRVVIGPPSTGSGFGAVRTMSFIDAAMAVRRSSSTGSVTGVDDDLTVLPDPSLDQSVVTCWRAFGSVTVKVAPPDMSEDSRFRVSSAVP